jgi:hypothetical protein
MIAELHKGGYLDRKSPIIVKRVMGFKLHHYRPYGRVDNQSCIVLRCQLLGCPATLRYSTRPKAQML